MLFIVHTAVETLPFIPHLFAKSWKVRIPWSGFQKRLNHFIGTDDHAYIWKFYVGQPYTVAVSHGSQHCVHVHLIYQPHKSSWEGAKHNSTQKVIINQLLNVNDEVKF